MSLPESKDLKATEEEVDMLEDLTTEEVKDHTEEVIIEDHMVDIVKKDKTGKKESQDKADNLEKEGNQENQENQEILVSITDNSDQTDMKNKTM